MAMNKAQRRYTRSVMLLMAGYVLTLFGVVAYHNNHPLHGPLGYAAGLLPALPRQVGHSCAQPSRSSGVRVTWAVPHHRQSNRSRKGIVRASPASRRGPSSRPATSRRTRPGR